MNDEKRLLWEKEFLAVNSVSTLPPKWMIPGLLVPGMVIISGPPKVFKSFLVLQIIASILDKKPVGHPSQGRLALKRGPVVYFAKEQSAGRIRYIYEERVLKRKMTEKVKSLDFAMPRNPWRWRIDEPEQDFVLENFLKDWQPWVCILDPLVYFHQLDENDPRVVFHIEPLRRIMLRMGGCLVVVHHNRKAPALQPGKGQVKSSWDDMRGTSALWGMADGGIMLQKNPSGAVTVSAEFKDYPSSQWQWRPTDDSGRSLQQEQGAGIPRTPGRSDGSGGGSGVRRSQIRHPQLAKRTEGHRDLR